MKIIKEIANPRFHSNEEIRINLDIMQFSTKSAATKSKEIPSMAFIIN